MRCAPLESGTFQAKRLRTGLRTSNVKAWKMVRKSAIDALGVRGGGGGERGRAQRVYRVLGVGLEPKL